MTSYDVWKLWSPWDDLTDEEFYPDCWFEDDPDEDDPDEE